MYVCLYAHDHTPEVNPNRASTYRPQPNEFLRNPIHSPRSNPTSLTSRFGFLINDTTHRYTDTRQEVRTPSIRYGTLGKNKERSVSQIYGGVKVTA